MLTIDGFSPATFAEPHTIEWLNAVLLVADLYDRITTTKSFTPSKRIKDIRRKFNAKRDDADLKRLNRVLLEEAYILETPKMPKKAIGLSEKEAIELRDMIELTLETGPRKQELLRLRCCDLNFETGMVCYHGKGVKTRFVPMNFRAREILKRRVNDRNGNEESFIFGDGKIAPKDFKKAFASACKRAGIENARPHDLRRTFGTRCAMAGVPPKTLQKWMGHEDIKTTMKYYVHIPEEFEKEAIERLGIFRKKDRQDDSSPEKGSDVNV